LASHTCARLSVRSNPMATRRLKEFRSHFVSVIRSMAGSSPVFIAIPPNTGIPECECGQERFHKGPVILDLCPQGQVQKVLVLPAGLANPRQTSLQVARAFPWIMDDPRWQPQEAGAV